MNLTTLACPSCGLKVGVIDPDAVVSHGCPKKQGKASRFVVVPDGAEEAVRSDSGRSERKP